MSLTLEEIWDRTFNLTYFTNMTVQDCNETLIRKLNWLCGRLHKEKTEEIEAHNKQKKLTK